MPIIREKKPFILVPNSLMESYACPETIGYYCLYRYGQISIDNIPEKNWFEINHWYQNGGGDYE